GSQRSSSASNRGRKMDRLPGDRGGRLRAPGSDRFQVRSQDKSHMMLLLSRAGLRYREKAIGPGAQTERRGEGWAGKAPAWRPDFAGRLTRAFAKLLQASICGACSRRWY